MKNNNIHFVPIPWNISFTSFLQLLLLVFLLQISPYYGYSLSTVDELTSEGKNNLQYFIDKQVKGLNLPSEESLISSQLESFHLFSHAQPGLLLIEGQWMDAPQITNWLQLGDFLKGKSHINIYGCEFAKNEKGKAAVAYLEATLGLSIAASDDITGINGDWDLEVGTPRHAIRIPNYNFNLQEFANWTSTSGDNTTGTGSFTCSEMPDFTYVVTGVVENVVIDDSEDFDNDNQTFEDVYGEANNEENLNIRITGNGSAGAITNFVTTVITFDEVVQPGNLAFSVIDIDVDQVKISGLDGNGNPIGSETINGWLRQLFDADNTEDGTDRPTWDYTANAVVGTSSTTGEYVYYASDNEDDTEASGAWFAVDNITVSQLTFTFSHIMIDSGNPSYHLYLATSCSDPCTEGAGSGCTATATDYDGDGVNDNCDLDDDNDGILDTDEGYCSSTTATTLAWESLGLSNGDPIPTGARYSIADDNFVNLDWAFISDGGTQEPCAGESDFIVYSTATQGGESGNLYLCFNNSLDDPDDKLAINFCFDRAVTGLSFTIADIDQHSTTSWDDCVEVYFTTSSGATYNAKTWAGTTIGGDAVNADNESFMDGFEGLIASVNTTTNGNVDMDFTGLEISCVQVRYFSGDDAQANPVDQLIAIHDFTYDACNAPQDTDGDGIADYRDLDSDGDGCPDAIEGGGRFGPADMNATGLPGGNSGGGYTGSFPNAVTENLTCDDVDMHGVPNIVGNPLGQGVGTSQDGSMLSDECGGPVIGTSKMLKDLASNGDGSFTATFVVYVENLGTFPLYDLSLTDNLTTEFGTLVGSTAAVDAAGEYAISSAPSLVASTSATVIGVNSTYNGSSDQNLVEPTNGDVLNVGGNYTVEFSIVFFPSAGKTTFMNQATAGGDISEDGTADGDTTDLSDASGCPCGVGGADLNGDCPTTSTGTSGSDFGMMSDPNCNGDPGEAGEDDPNTFTIAPVCPVDAGTLSY